MIHHFCDIKNGRAERLSEKKPQTILPKPFTNDAMLPIAAKKWSSSMKPIPNSFLPIADGYSASSQIIKEKKKRERAREKNLKTQESKERKKETKEKERERREMKYTHKINRTNWTNGNERHQIKDNPFSSLFPLFSPFLLFSYHVPAPTMTPALMQRNISHNSQNDGVFSVSKGEWFSFSRAACESKKANAERRKERRKEER